jgi:hypothetical protein
MRVKKNGKRKRHALSEYSYLINPNVEQYQSTSDSKRKENEIIILEEFVHEVACFLQSITASL